MSMLDFDFRNSKMDSYYKNNQSTSDFKKNQTDLKRRESIFSHSKLELIEYGDPYVNSVYKPKMNDLHYNNSSMSLNRPETQSYFNKFKVKIDIKRKSLDKITRDFNVSNKMESKINKNVFSIY